MSSEKDPVQQESEKKGINQPNPLQVKDISLEIDRIRAVLSTRQNYRRATLHSSSIFRVLLYKFLSNRWAWLLWLMFLVGPFALLYWFHFPARMDPNKSYQTFKQNLINSQVSSVTITGDLMNVRPKSGSAYITAIPESEASVLLPALISENVKIEFGKLPPSVNRVPISLTAIGLIAAAFIIYQSRRRGSQQNTIPDFYRSPAKLLRLEVNKLTFKSIVMSPRAKQWCDRLVDFLKDPKRYQKLGGRLDKGFLVFGPPGTGKTLLLKTLAGEIDATVFHAIGAEFFSGFPGAAVARIQDTFEQARRNAPCLLLIDEIDSLVRPRSIYPDPVHFEHEMALSQFLAEMDSIENHEGLIVVGATNRPDLIDEALLRPGRFDVAFEMSYPDVAQLEGILKLHARNVKLDPSVDLAELAEYSFRSLTPCSGAHAAEILNRGAKMCAEESRKAVAQEYLKRAVDDIKSDIEHFEKASTR